MGDFLGRFTLEALEHDWIENLAGLSAGLGGMAALIWLTWAKRWGWLWKDWLTSLDPKRIGIMYLFLSTLMLFKGLVDAAMMRAQQALSVGDSFGYISPSHFQQIFTAHGTTMIFFVAMGLVFALFNLVIPLQIGARDVAFPFINSVSFWLFAVGAMLVMVSLNVGHFSGAGWTGYPPLSELAYNPGTGVDYWIWSLQISGVGSLLSGINFLVTIFKMRCPGMTLMRMPILVWSALASMILVVFAFPILTATLWMLSLDRLLGMHLFTADCGGNAMMYVNLIWAWGHPEVYILVLPAFGIFSEVVATFSKKRLFGYLTMVWAIALITLLSFIVWLHHFFTMGAGANVNAFFGIMTMLIAVPTGVKIFNWLFTMYKGRIELATPILWFLGFVFIFTTGGMTGVLMSIAPVDFQTHNSLFLIAHFHSMVIGGVLFGLLAGITYWFPKFAGFKLDERTGKWAFWFWFIGFLVAFMPLYVLGLMGATRRLDHYAAETGWQPLFVVAGVGVVLIVVGFVFQVLQLWVSIRDRKKNRDVSGDPWDGRTLEWSTPSPPPFYNFAVEPHVHGIDPFWDMKEKGKPKEKPVYEEIHLPKNSGCGLFIGIFSFFVGFGIIWYMFWLALVGLLGVIVSMTIYLSKKEPEQVFSAEEIKKWEAGIWGK